MKIAESRIRKIIIEELLSEIGPGIGMDPTGSTMPREMDRSEYKQLETADPENTRMVWSIIDPTGLLSIPDVPPAIEAFETDSSVFNGVILILSVGAVIPLVGYGPKLGSKMLKGIAKALKLVKTKVPPNFAAKADEMLASVSAAHQELASNINKIKDDLYNTQLAASGKPGFASNRPPMLPRRALSNMGYEDALKVGAKASVAIPDIAFPVFAKKLLVRIGSRLSRINTAEVYVYFPDDVKTGPIKRMWGGVETQEAKSAFTYANVIKWWDEIPGNPEGLGFKDLEPKLIGFELKNILDNKTINSLAEEMFNQFPAMKKVFVDIGYFAEDVSMLIIKIGSDANSAGNASGNYISITPYNSAADFSRAWKNSGELDVFIKDTLAKGKTAWAHEFDHWLRKLSHRRSGVNLGKAWQGGYHLPDGSIDMKIWLSKFYEFEAEFSQGQMNFLDELFRNGMTDEVAEVLSSPQAFENHFFQQLPLRDWQGPVGEEALKRVRKRLFDTERGLYYSLRRLMKIEDAPVVLPESVEIDTEMWNIIAGLDN